MLFIFLLFNIFFLILVGVLLGFLGIELEVGVFIVFVVIFGIVVDDIIYFFSKYKLVKNKGLELEFVMCIIFLEMGKAIVLIFIILFFGFLVMLFFIYLLSVMIGLLISLIFLSVLISDLLFILLLICWIMLKF